jgi:hypothetical protein
MTYPSLNPRKFAIWMLAIVTGAATMPASAALYEDHPGGETVAHYVMLIGHAGDNNKNRELLLVENAACADLKKTAGLSAQLLSPDEIPAVPQTKEIEIYYAADRVLIVTRGVVHRIDDDNCALRAYPHYFHALHTQDWTCNINMLKREAYGICGVSGLPPTPRPLLRESNPHPGTTEMKDIAGHRCEIHRHATIGYEVCIATPPSSFIIPPSAFNAGKKGLVLDIANPALTARARRVKLHLEVANSLFSIPQGVKLLAEEHAKR